MSEFPFCGRHSRFLAGAKMVITRFGAGPHLQCRRKEVVFGRLTGCPPLGPKNSLEQHACLRTCDPDPFKRGLPGWLEDPVKYARFRKRPCADALEALPWAYATSPVAHLAEVPSRDRKKCRIMFTPLYTTARQLKQPPPPCRTANGNIVSESWPR